MKKIYVSLFIIITVIFLLKIHPLKNPNGRAGSPLPAKISKDDFPMPPVSTKQMYAPSTLASGGQGTARPTSTEPNSSGGQGTARPTRPPSETPFIYFNGKAYETQKDAINRLVLFQNTLQKPESRIALMGFAVIPNTQQRQALSDHGITLLSYIADQGWLARIYAGSTPTLDFLTFFKPLETDMKISPSLLSDSLPDEVPVYVHLATDRSETTALQHLHDAGFDQLSLTRSGVFPFLSGMIPLEQLDEFLTLSTQHEDVQHIEPGMIAQLMNDTSAKILQSGSYTGTTPIFDQGIYGSNQIIAVCDTGIDIDSCYFRDTFGTLPPTNNLYGTNINLSLRKVIACNFFYSGDDPDNSSDWDNQGHGTHVSGHAAASNISDPLGTSTYNGMAPAAKLIMQDAGFVTWDNCADLIGLGCPVVNFYPALIQAVKQGAVLHNNSWGDRENYFPHNTYTEPCRELDLVTWSNKEFLVVCAAGNNGTANGAVASPSTAKNSLSVAAAQNGSNQESLGSFNA